MDHDGSPHTINPTRLQWLLLGLILAGAATARVLYLNYEAHFDELWHLELSTGRGSQHITLPMNTLIDVAASVTTLAGAPPWYVIPTTLDTVTHPPLYPILLRGWRETFGQSIAVARMFSAVLSLLCIVALFDAVRQLHGVSAALWACLITALSATQVELAQQIRNYPLVLLTTLLAAATLLRIQRRGPTPLRLILLAAFVAAALCSHYLAAGAIVALFIYAAWTLCGPARIKTLCTVACAIAVFSLAWLPQALQQSAAFADATQFRVARSDAHSMAAVLRRTAAAPMRLLFEPRPPSSAASLLSGAFFLIPLLLLRRRRDLLLWVILLWCIIGLPLILDLLRGTDHLEHVSHFILAAPAVYALLAAMPAGMRPLARHGVPALAVLACLGALGYMYWRDGERFSEMGEHLRNANDDAPFVFYADSPHRWWCHVMYLGAAHYSGKFPRPVVRLDAPADDAMLRQLRRSDNLWLVWGCTSLPPQQIVAGTQVVWFRPLPDIGSVAQLRWIEPQPARP